MHAEPHLGPSTASSRRPLRRTAPAPPALCTALLSSARGSSPPPPALPPRLPQVKLFDTKATPACPAAAKSALLDSITACDDYCVRDSWSFEGVEWAVTAGSDVFGFSTSMPLLTTKYQKSPWPTCPNSQFTEPPACPGTSGPDGKPAPDGTPGSGAGEAPLPGGNCWLSSAPACAAR